MTYRNARESSNSDQTDSDNDIEGNNKFKERELKESSLPFLVMRYNVDEPNMSPSEIVNIAPREGQIRVSVTSGPNWEALAFPKDFLQEETIPMKKEKLNLGSDINVLSRWSITDIKDIADR